MASYNVQLLNDGKQLFATSVECNTDYMAVYSALRRYNFKTRTRVMKVVPVGFHQPVGGVVSVRVRFVRR